MVSSLNAIFEGDPIHSFLVFPHLAFWGEEPVELDGVVREGNLLAVSLCLLRIVYYALSSIIFGIPMRQPLLFRETWRQGAVVHGRDYPFDRAESPGVERVIMTAGFTAFATQSWYEPL